MFIVPVSGHVCRTACDSARINTQVSPVSGNEMEDLLHDRRTRAAQRRAEDGHHLIRGAIGEAGAPAEIH